MLVDGQRAKCVTPSFPMSGPVDFAMSTDGGQNFNFTAAFFVGKVYSSMFTPIIINSDSK